MVCWTEYNFLISLLEGAPNTTVIPQYFLQEVELIFSLQMNVESCKRGSGKSLPVHKSNPI